MINSITHRVHKRLKQGSRKDLLITAICDVDHDKLWEQLYQIHLAWVEDSLKIDQDIRHKLSKYGPIYGTIDMLKGFFFFTVLYI